MSLARIGVIALGMAAIAWAGTVVPLFRAESAIVNVAPRIIIGEVYKPETMQRLLAIFQHGRNSRFRAATVSKAAIIQLRSSEETISAGDPQMIDASLDALGHTIDQAFAGTPTDPFLWLVPFWLENTRKGFKAEHLHYLRMSYALGPNEGWIAVKRNRLALASFSALPADLAEAAISEFLGLVRSGLYTEAADIVAGPAWPIRHILLARLNDLNESDRRPFAKQLYDKGLSDVPVPGVEPRPWR